MSGAGMHEQRAARRAWIVWTVAVLLTAATIMFTILNRGTTTGSGTLPVWLNLSYAMLFLLIASIGALIIARQPDNATGWLMAGLGIIGSLPIASEAYASNALLVNPGVLPFGEVAAWFNIYLGDNFFGDPIFLLLLVFPTGSLLSPRWRIYLWLEGVRVILITLGELQPGTIENFDAVEVQNPIALNISADLLQALLIVGILIEIGLAIAAITSLMIRFRRSRGVERQQLKWLLYGGMIFSLVLIAGPLFWFGVVPFGEAWPILFFPGIATIPVCVGIAILRYDLYDIDQIINRAIVYTVLTTGLIGVYAGTVLVLTMVSAPLVGDSNLIVAISTLLVAALFRPARNRIQALVDRHFYRQKYDAARTVEDFSSRLRGEVDLDALTGDLQEVVQETIQPAHVSLWLRPSQ